MLSFRIGEIDAASEFVRRIHYSGTIQNPSAIVCVGTWHEPGGLFGDRGDCVAACVFSISTSKRREYVIELTRLCRAHHIKEPLSSLLSQTCSFIKNKKLADCLISFADVGQNHHGGIYQASSWNYTGLRSVDMTEGIFKDGVYIPDRSCNDLFGTRSISKLQKRFPQSKFSVKISAGKHLYWRGLTVRGNTIARNLGYEKLAYPKPLAVSPLDERQPMPSEAGASPADRSMDCALKSQQHADS